VENRVIKRHLPFFAAGFVGFWLMTAGCATGPSPDPISGTGTGPSPEPGRVSIDYDDLHYLPPVYGDQAIVKGSINGVSGYFIIDTGAMQPMITHTAVERCGLVPTPSKGVGVDAWGKQMNLMQATNVTVKLAPAVAIHWPVVGVLPGDIAHLQGTNFFLGIIDYCTLKTGRAVIDTVHRKIIVTK
jgi:hypothetical protein